MVSMAGHSAGWSKQADAMAAQARPWRPRRTPTRAHPTGVQTSSRVGGPDPGQMSRLRHCRAVQMRARCPDCDIRLVATSALSPPPNTAEKAYDAGGRRRWEREEGTHRLRQRKEGKEEENEGRKERNKEGDVQWW